MGLGAHLPCRCRPAAIPLHPTQTKYPETEGQVSRGQAFQHCVFWVFVLFCFFWSSLSLFLISKCPLACPASESICLLQEVHKSNIRRESKIYNSKCPGLHIKQADEKSTACYTEGWCKCYNDSSGLKEETHEYVKLIGGLVWLNHLLHL